MGLCDFRRDKGVSDQVRVSRVFRCSLEGRIFWCGLLIGSFRHCPVRWYLKPSWGQKKSVSV